MSKGPIRGRSRSRRRAELGPEPGLVPTTDGTAVPRALPMVPMAPVPVDSQALAQRWARLEAKALDVVELGVDGAFDDPDHYRARLAAADRVLGFRKGGLPMPVLGGSLREATVERRVIKLRWADGRPVVMPLHQPGQKDDDEEDLDE